MSTTVNIAYGASTALTITLAALGTSSTLITGRASTAVDNTSDLAIDALVGGKVTIGTAPTTGKLIEIYLYGSYDGTTYSGGATGVDAALTPQDKSLLSLLIGIPTNSTSDQLYSWGPFSVAQAFGGSMPKKWGVFITHNTAVNLNAVAGNHEIKYTPITYTGT